jgi:hypothetical protein
LQIAERSGANLQKGVAVLGLKKSQGLELNYSKSQGACCKNLGFNWIYELFFK